MKPEVTNRRAKAKSSDKPAGSAAVALKVSLTNLVFLMVGMGLMALLGIFTPALRSRHEPGSGAGRAPASAPGPWGELEFTRLTLEEPDDHLPDSTRKLETARWYFERATPAILESLFRSIDVTASIQALLLDTNRWKIAPDGIVVQPTRELLLGLGSPARQRIYSILDQSELNPAHHDPFRFRADGFDEWFARRGLSQEKLKLLRSLTFTNRGGALCLVDIDVLQQTFTPAEFHQVFQSLYSEPSLQMFVHVRPDSDIEALVSYWGRGGREGHIRPLLKSLARTPDGGSINVSYLLPPFAHLRLYTFDNAPTHSVIGQDCFFTALNFFNDRPDPRLAEQAYALALLNQNYSETTESRRYGDVLILLDEKRKTVHACVFIADDVVFTKNGADELQPWVLMKIPDMLAHYATERTATLVTMRPKRP